MNKKELCNTLAERTGLNKTESPKAFNAAIEIITNEMKQNGRITFIGFGLFSVKQKAARKEMNPTSFVPIDIPVKKIVNFKPSIYLNHLLNIKKRGRKRKDENNTASPGFRQGTTGETARMSENYMASIRSRIKSF